MSRKSACARPAATDVFETTDFYFACSERFDRFPLAGTRRNGTRPGIQFEDRTECESVT